MRLEQANKYRRLAWIHFYQKEVIVIFLIEWFFNAIYWTPNAISSLIMLAEVMAC